MPLSVLGVISSSLLIVEKLVGLYLSIAVLSAVLILNFFFGAAHLGGASSAADIGAGIFYLFSILPTTAVLWYWVRPSIRWYIRSASASQAEP